MKKFFIFLLVFTLLIGSINAQESAKYNFGSMQAAKELNMAPGEVAITKLYFYNIYGNRITHISLSVGEAPENWEISFEPALHETTVEISGIPTTIEENLYVEVSEAVEEIPEDIPEGIEYISSSVGYIGANPVEIKIKVPADEDFGKYKITISALAEWLGQAGAVAFNQARSFDYDINVVSKEFTEEVIEKEEVEEEKEEVKQEVKQEITGAVVAEPEEGKSNNLFILGILGLVVLVLIIIFLLFKISSLKKE